MQVAGDTLQHHDVQFGERNKRHIFHTTPAEKRVVLVLLGIGALSLVIAMHELTMLAQDQATVLLDDVPADLYEVKA